MKKQLYIFYLGHENFYKIGITWNWKKRLSVFKCANPWIEPVCVFEVENARAYEKELHDVLEKLYDACVCREIFQLSPEHLVMLREIIVDQYEAVEIKMAGQP